MTPNNNISNILKPKTPEEINPLIKNMSSFEFVHKFKQTKLKNLKHLKISFKKKFIHFFILSFPKIFMKVYWVIMSIWLLICLANILKTHINKHIFSYIKIFDHIFLVLIVFSLIVSIMMLIYEIRFKKYEKKITSIFFMDDII